MYNFWIQTITHYRGLNDWYKGPPFIANFVLFPAITILTWAILGRFAINAEAAKFFAIGQIVSTAAYSIFCASTMSYANDRWYSTINLLYISPASRFQNFASRGILMFPIGLVACVTCLVVIRLVTPLDFGAINWPSLILTLLVVNLTIVAFAQFLSIFSIIFREWLNTLAIALGLILILTGVAIPLTIFPVWVQELGKLIPITNALAALRLAFAGEPFSAGSASLLREVITGALYFMAGYFGFVLFEKVGKRSGALEMEDLN
jgi:ABC-2 type transport system permease protein